MQPTTYCSKWEWHTTYSGGIEVWAEADLTSAPDDVSFYYALLAADHVFFHFNSESDPEINATNKGFLYQYDNGVEILFEVDLASTPDNVISFWASLFQEVVVFYPRDRELVPGQPLFAGDMGAYIG